MLRLLSAISIFFLLWPSASADEPSAQREALSRFQFLVGPWRATGRSYGDKEEAWQESVAWEWDVGTGFALVAMFEGGRVFRSGRLEAGTEADAFVFLGVRADGRETRYAGAMKGARLILEEVVAEGAAASERIVLHPLHDNRYLLLLEARPGGRGSFKKAVELGCTREGEPFVKVDPAKMCPVTGGLGTIGVTYEGKTYWVCCTGCKIAFDKDPARFLANRK